MKRVRGSLTGGTGDINPQFINATVTMSAANTYTETTIVMPIARFPIQKSRSIVVELLKVFWNCSVKDSNHAAGGDSSLMQAHLATATLTNFTPESSLVLATYEKEYRGAFTAAGTFQTVSGENDFTTDLTDGAGHGVLVATDRMFLGANTTNFTGAGTARAKIMYRFKDVSLEEYIGIVQSQTG